MWRSWNSAGRSTGATTAAGYASFLLDISPLFRSLTRPYSSQAWPNRVRASGIRFSLSDPFRKNRDRPLSVSHFFSSLKPLLITSTLLSFCYSGCQLASTSVCCSRVEPPPAIPSTVRRWTTHGRRLVLAGSLYSLQLFHQWQRPDQIPTGLQNTVSVYHLCVVLGMEVRFKRFVVPAYHISFYSTKPFTPWPAYLAGSSLYFSICLPCTWFLPQDRLSVRYADGFVQSRLESEPVLTPSNVAPKWQSSNLRV